MYVLACGKDFFTYAEIFSKLKEFQPRLNQKTIIVDFEQAAIKAVHQIFPEVEVYGFFFHFCQCIYRQIQANGLQSIYGEDVSRRFDELKDLDFFKEKLNGKSAVDVGVQTLLSYFEKTWIGHFARNRFVPPLLSINLWNFYSHSCLFPKN